jgi:hypothetical protein
MAVSGEQGRWLAITEDGRQALAGDPGHRDCIDRPRIAPGRGWDAPIRRAGYTSPARSRAHQRAARAVLTRSNATPTAIGYPVSTSGDNRCDGGAAARTCGEERGARLIR